MRVLMLTWEYPPYVVGGMGKHVAELTPALARQAAQDASFHLDLVTTRLGGGEAVERLQDRVAIHRVETPPMDPQDMYNSVIAANQPLMEKAIQLGEEHSYDLIHIHDWLVGEAGIALKHRWKTPLVPTIHATERGRHQGHLPSRTSYHIDRMEWRLCYEAWKIIVCSRYMAQELQAFFQAPADKIVVIPNGVDVTPFRNHDGAALARLRRLHAPNGEPLLFFVGRMTHEKGIQNIIRAMPRILEKYPDAVLLAAGRNGERYLPLAQELGVADRVRFLGYVSDEERNALYRIVDAAIFPSLYEPFGIVALEAMAAGTNVIVSDVGGLGEVITHQENGLTVYPDDPESIAWAVDHLFQDPEAAARRRERASWQVETQYSWDRIAAATLAVYREVVAERQLVQW